MTSKKFMFGIFGLLLLSMILLYGCTEDSDNGEVTNENGESEGEVGVEGDCEEQFLEEYECYFDFLRQKYQNSDCSTDWRYIEHCMFYDEGGFDKCEENSCIEEPEYLEVISSANVVASYETVKTLSLVDYEEMQFFGGHELNVDDDVPIYGIVTASIYEECSDDEDKEILLIEEGYVAGEEVEVKISSFFEEVLNEVIYTNNNGYYSIDFTPEESGDYTVEVSIEAGGCQEGETVVASTELTVSG